MESIAKPDCLLFMWAPPAILEDAIQLALAWGFNYSTVGFVWDKQASNPGEYTLIETEMVLIFKRGKIPTPRGARNLRQLISIKRGSHSKKPPHVRSMIVKMFPKADRIELFARRDTTPQLVEYNQFKDWDIWGNEA